jgi:hypothetical protein
MLGDQLGIENIPIGISILDIQLNIDDKTN